MLMARTEEVDKILLLAGGLGMSRMRKIYCRMYFY
jgi:hypothetical protein